MNTKDNNKAALSRRRFLEQAAVITAGFSIIPRHVLGGKDYVAPSDKINLGFIGTGRQGVTLQRYFTDTGEEQIIAACDVYKHKLNNFVRLTDAFYTEKYGSTTSYKSCIPYHDFRDLLANKDVDAVVIATPDHWHSSIAVRAAAAGKDIYCEKPLSLTIEEGRAMVNATRKYKRVFQTGSMQRSWPEFIQTAEIIRNGYLGEITEINVILGNPPIPYNLPEEPVPDDLDWDLWLGPNEYVHYNHELNPVLNDPLWARWRDFKGLGGGDMTDWGGHMFDIVQWSLDKDNAGPVEIIPPDGKDYQLLTYIYENGIKMTHETVGKKRAIEYTGTEGKLEVQRRKLVTTPASLATRKIGANEIQVYRSSDHYKDFFQAMRNRSKPVADVEIGHRSATVCNLGNIAYELGRPLQWDYKKEQFENDAEANKLRGRSMKREWRI